MGGNAIKNVKTSRLTLEQHKEITKRILDRVENTTGTLNYPNKKSFGDVDIYITINAANEIERKRKLTEYVERVGGLVDNIVFNNHITSFIIPYIDEDEEKLFQVDFFECLNREFISFYYSYNYLSQILFRMLTSVNLRYNNKGLFIELNQRTAKIIYKVETPEFSTLIHISDDPNEICNILELSYEDFKKGFNTKEEIFEWLSVSRYYRKLRTKEFGSLNIAIIDDILDYQAKDQEIVKKYGETNDEIIRLVQKYNLNEKLYEIIKQVSRENLLKTNYSFKIFLDIGCPKNKIGKLMTAYKSSKGDQFEDYIIDTPIDEIKKDILKFQETM